MGDNPFKDENGLFFVLVNDQDEYLIWPMLADVPAGYRRVFGAEVRQECLSYVEDNWSDMRLADLQPPGEGHDQ